MDKRLHLRFRQLFGWIIALIIFSLGLFAFDLVCLQKNPIIWIGNYSDVVLTIWEVQTTIASLTVASVAFILSKIDIRYYGISIKDLLHLPRYFPKINLSFWEKLICSIILPAVTWFFVILNNMTVVVFFLFITVYFTTSILIECINVITRSSFYEDWAQKIIDQLVNTIIASSNSEDNDSKESAKKQLCIVLDRMELEVSSKIRKGENVNDNNSYIYLVRLMDKH